MAKAKHPRWHDVFNASIEDTAKEIGDLRYDDLATFVRALSIKIANDGEKDRQGGRVKLADSLREAALNIKKGAEDIDTSWDISAPHMK